MAKRMMNNSMNSKKGCSCHIGKMLVGVLLMAAGLYAVVQGFQMQTSFEGIAMGKIFLYYAIGIFLVCVGKFFKKMSYMCCDAHNMCK